MVWNKYSVKLFIYLVTLSLLGFGLFWSIYSKQLIITNIVFLALFVLIFILLLLYLNKTNSDLNQFLKSIQYLDNLPFSKNSDLSHGQLNLTYNKIIDQLKDAWIEKEYEHQYFKFVLEQIGVGIITFDKSGDVEIYNKTAKEIFGLEILNNIKQLDAIKSGLADEINEIRTGETKLIKFDGSIENIKILVKATEIKIEKRNLKLISFQNIKTQLEESELEAWQKLIRVLTHEIMNSVTPIKSLTYSMQKTLSQNENQEVENLAKGLKAIENRSKGLLDFVESYKNLTQIPKPNYERIQLRSLFNEILGLLNDELLEKDIQFKSEIDPNDLSIIADKKLVSQVIINLIRNSVFALEDTADKKIAVTAKLKDNKVCIEVKDNGKGIVDEIRDKIFVPFYTTRPNGSGIGLSFVRQVMVMHNGFIDVKSEENKETIFSLYF